ncbi:GRB2-associated-binding protein 1 isoform X5 [Oncorhynchus tshawytscha]|uniref:GRB2-associated-binding protein 1 isoform X5 n=1 Tax=Oncorhynchus tshawytscha TaxID=74940 RepID=UPI001C3C1EEC|nr:GRB2-associated-binding protein 1 isoform X5 [Oncorhynchus tshawytscha]
MSGGDVVCSGWLRKSPPEKKLRRYAWKKRWFVLRSGRLSGDPDVLEYYKNDHAKKPIRVIDLNLCEQVDAGLTFNKKDLEHSFIFDIKTIDRVFYLVADTEDDMNKWVRYICDICGFNPTDDEAAKAAHQAASGGSVVDTPPHPGLGGPPAMLTNVPPPYQPVSVRHLDSESSLDEPQDYLWLVNCESKKPEPNRAHAECSKSTSSETDLNDNVPAHRTPTSTSSSSKHANGFFSSVLPPHPSSASSIYDSPPSRGGDLSSSLYHLPRSYSQDTVLLPKSASASSPPVPVDGDAPELYVFNTPSRKPSMETQMRNLSVSYDIPPTPGSNCTYQVPRGPASGGSEGGDGMPPPRPPKPSLSSLTPGHPPPPAERSPTDTYCVPRSMSETDGNYCVPTSAGNKALRSNTIGTMDSSRLRKDLGSQDCYDIPRTFPSDKSCSFDFNESFNSYLKNKGMMPVGSQSMEEVDQNYVPMSANSPSHHRSGSLSGCEPIMEPNYVPMTPGPGTLEFSLGKQVPPPAHMGFRSSPNTPPRRPMLISDCQPPPVDRNLKPDRKAKPAPLEIKPLPEWEESSAPVRSPVTRSFAREEESFYCTVPITPVKREMEGLDTVEENMKLGAPMTADGGSSPMVKPKGDKQVEYLDLDLDPGKSTPPRKKKSNGIGLAVSDERVDYVVVDQQRTQALKSTREAWNDGRQSTETDTSTKGPK